MKIAYLIAAHTDPTHLSRLINALHVEGATDFYVHLDKKVNMNDYRKKISIFTNKVTWVSDRIDARWGGYSQCRYQKSLIKSCVESNVKYDRVFFLSGLDYPLLSNKDIFDVLVNNADKEFIAGKDITHTEEVRQHKKIRQYHFFRDLPIKNPTLFRCVKGAAQLLMKYLPIRRTGYIFTRGKRCDIYYGSSWWCLSGACLGYVYNELFGNPDWENYFRFAYTPDELMIQSIVFNSPFNLNISY